MHQFEAGPEKLRLDEFLAREMTEISVVRLRRMIAEGDVLVNGLPSLKGRRLTAGDSIRVWSTLVGPTSATPEAIPLEIIHEDDDLIGVNKPPGLLTHPSHTTKSGTLANGLAHHFLATAGRPIRAGLVHRLDRDTSGVIVVAKTLRAHRILAKAFRDRRVRKTYLALLSGSVILDEGEINAPIGCERDEWPHWRVMPSGRPAITDYSVAHRFASHTLVELRPRTGRTHQLRIHTALLGNPIVGDAIYATTRDLIADRYQINHQLLHAHRLAFVHPTGGGEMTLQAPLPALWLRLFLSI